MKGQWHEAYPATFEEIREDTDEVKRQNIIWEVVKSHMDFCEDLLTVKNVRQKKWAESRYLFLEVT